MSLVGQWPLVLRFIFLYKKLTFDKLIASWWCYTDWSKKICFQKFNFSINITEEIDVKIALEISKLFFNLVLLIVVQKFIFFLLKICVVDKDTLGFSKHTHCWRKDRLQLTIGQLRNLNCYTVYFFLKKCFHSKLIYFVRTGFFF